MVWFGQEEAGVVPETASAFASMHEPPAPPTIVQFGRVLTPGPWADDDPDQQEAGEGNDDGRGRTERHGIGGGAVWDARTTVAAAIVAATTAGEDTNNRVLLQLRTRRQWDGGGSDGGEG